MLYLGFSQDRYHAGVTLTDGDRVLYAADEERHTRRKNQGGLPIQALAAAFRCTGARPADVSHIVCAGIMTPPFPGRLLPRLQQWIFREEKPSKRSVANRLVDLLAFYTPLAHTDPESRWRDLALAILPATVRRTLTAPLRHAPIAFVEHHRCHGFAACQLSGFDDALCLTGDGMGDGLSMTVSRWQRGRLERLWSAASRESPGLFYEMLTDALGFIPNRHEGKVTGLAAHGDPRAVGEPSPFGFEGDRLVYRGPHGQRCVTWARERLLPHYSREDIAAWVQAILEDVVVAVARTWLERTGASRLAVAGGIFGNVKLNQRLHEVDGVEELFVCPNMGDGGLSVGAIAAAGGLSPQRLEHVFWGDAVDDANPALRRHGLAAEPCGDVEERVAERLAEGFLVARCRGAMEWGPRALGNRSVLAPANDPRVVERLNRCLRRSEFMPFAPAILEEDAGDLLVGVERARHAAEFMTVCFAATPALRRDHAAVVHVDGTVRAQIVRRDANPSFHRLLAAYKRRTGAGVVLNTSFNLHEEPIVRTADEAIASFVASGLDYLALGDCVVRGAQVNETGVGGRGSGAGERRIARA